MIKSQKVKIGLGTFNLVKGIGVLVIIFVHMTTRYSLERVPQLVPLYLMLRVLGGGLLSMFFMISGIQFKPKPIKIMLKKTFSEMMIPYLWGGLGCYVFYLALNWPFIEWDNLRYCSQLLLGAFVLGLPKPITFMAHDLFSTQALWFFMAMFIAFNLLNLILKADRAPVQILLAILCAGIGYVLLRLDFVYYCIPQGMMATGFCYAGYVIKQQKLIDRLINSVWTYAILVPVYLLMAAYGSFDLAAGDFTLLEYVGALFSAILFILLGVFGSRITWVGLDQLKKIGMYSYWIICIHGVEMLVCPYYAMVEALSDHSPLWAFGIEVILKILILSTGCRILKKISQEKYKKKKQVLAEM